MAILYKKNLFLIILLLNSLFSIADFPPTYLLKAKIYTSDSSFIGIIKFEYYLMMETKFAKDTIKENNILSNFLFNANDTDICNFLKGNEEEILQKIKFSMTTNKNEKITIYQQFRYINAFIPELKNIVRLPYLYNENNEFDINDLQQIEILKTYKKKYTLEYGIASELSINNFFWKNNKPIEIKEVKEFRGGYCRFIVNSYNENENLNLILMEFERLRGEYEKATNNRLRQDIINDWNENFINLKKMDNIIIVTELCYG